MKELLPRIVTGSAYIGLTLLAAWTGPFTLFILYLPVVAQAANEFYQLYWTEGKAPTRAWTITMTAVMYSVTAISAVSFENSPTFELSFAAMLVMLTAGSMLIRQGSSPAQDLAGHVLVLVYIALPFALMPHILAMQGGLHLLYGAFILLWTNDTGAFVVGKLIGKRKLMPSVSPGKTIEGAIGGAVLSVLIAILLSQFWLELSTTYWIIAALLIHVTSVLGDLFESALKRDRNVKDSGDLLPGHGGILDRFDGLLFSFPCYYLFLNLFV